MCSASVTKSPRHRATKPTVQEVFRSWALLQECFGDEKFFGMADHPA
jgi:hypothetical protein